MWAYVADTPQLNLGVLKVEGMSVLGGGYPIFHEGQLVGAIGVSGNRGMPEDQAVAQAAVAAMIESIG